MRSVITVIITAGLSWLLSLAFGWWMVALVPLLISLIAGYKPGMGFVNGLVSIGLLWLYLVLKTDMDNEQILSDKMAELFGLSHTIFLVVNVAVGALVGGMGGWSGASLPLLFKKEKTA